MKVTLLTSDSPSIDWGAKGSDEIVQNVFCLLNTFKYEVAFDRTLGINSEIQDKPLQNAVVETIAQIYEVIDEREPRATIDDVTFIGLDNEGNMNFKVVIEI